MQSILNKTKRSPIRNPKTNTKTNANMLFKGILLTFVSASLSILQGCASSSTLSIGDIGGYTECIEDTPESRRRSIEIEQVVNRGQPVKIINLDEIQ